MNIDYQRVLSFDMRNIKIRVFFVSKTFSKIDLIWSDSGYFYCCEGKLLSKKPILQISPESGKRNKLR